MVDNKSVTPPLLQCSIQIAHPNQKKSITDKRSTEAPFSMAREKVEFGHRCFLTPAQENSQNEKDKENEKEDVQKLVNYYYSYFF